MKITLRGEAEVLTIRLGNLPIRSVERWMRANAWSDTPSVYRAFVKRGDASIEAMARDFEIFTLDPLGFAVSRLGSLSIRHYPTSPSVIGANYVTRTDIVRALKSDDYQFERFADRDGCEWTWITRTNSPQGAIPSFAKTRCPPVTTKNLFALASVLR